MGSVSHDSLRGWRIVASSFLATFTVFGIVYSFGAFFRPMATEFGASRETTSAIFAITAFIYFMLGPLTGHLSDRLGPRPIVAFGALAMAAGLIATTFIARLQMAYLTYGLGVGAGVACCYVPLVSGVSGWFTRRRNTALGIAVSGIGAGTLAIPPLSAELIGRWGWRDADLGLGVAAAVLLMICAALAERPPHQPAIASFHIGPQLRTPNFVMLYLAGMLWTIATAVPFVFLTPYAEGHGIGRVSAAALVSLIGLASTVGRLGLGTLGDRIGLIHLYRLCILSLGLSFSIWFVADSYLMLAIFALVMGASYGGAVTLTPAVMAELFGTRGLGVMLGTLYTSSAIGTLLGPPLCGAIVDRTGSYSTAIALTGGVTIVGCLLLTRLRPASSYA
ncbi:MAG TPA: MFS transporter [Candidatus Binataceae bacterium]|nr:MFS transporter [Candidatus Binataceae bacterium]